MKRIIVSTSMIVFLASTFALGLGFRDGIKGIIPSAQAKDGADDQGGDSFKCTVEELSGGYGVLSDGEFITPGFLPPNIELPAGPFAAVGRLTVNSNKTFVLTLTQSFNGVIVPKTSFPGTFDLNAADCTGSLNLQINNAGTVVPVPFEFVVVDEGKEIKFMRTTSGSVITGVATSQED